MKDQRNRESPERTINITVSQDTTFGRQIVQGIIAYVRKHPNWRIAMHAAAPFTPWTLLNQHPGDGILAAVYNQANVDILSSTGVPVVNVSSSPLGRQFPSIHVDNARIGQLGAQHLIDKGLERFVFVGVSPPVHDQLRCQGFREALQTKGFSCAEYFPTLDWGPNNLLTNGKFYTGFLSAQRFPIGVMASNDMVAFGVLEACRLLELQCPEQVAVIGCDNDETMCRLSSTTLTSIDPAADSIGYQAAELLEQLIQGREPSRIERQIPPRGVEARNSTDVRGIGDVHVSDAVRFIRDHAGEMIYVSDVLDAIPLSRRALERRFDEAIGHGIAEEIHRVHIERAKELLKHTDLSLTRIALCTGYHGVARFQANFERIVGISAAAYRRMESVEPADADNEGETD